MTMTEILLEARAEGLSYGHYVAKYRPHTSFAEREDAQKANLRRFKGENIACASRTCEQCGKIFVSLSKSVRFCSSKCKSTYTRAHKTEAGNVVQKTCVICGKPFSTTRSTQLCCSAECSAANKSLWQSRKWERTKSQRAPAHCAVCGKEMIDFKGRVYCSPECRKEMSRRRSAAYREAHDGNSAQK